MTGIAFASAALIIAYPGMVLYESLSIRPWHSALVPAQFIAHAIASSLGLTLVVLALGGRLSAVQTELAVGFLVSLVATLGITHMYVLDRVHEHSPAAQAGVHRMLRGKMAGHFWASVVAFPSFGPMLIAVGGLLTVLGSLQFRYAHLRSGVKVSPAGLRPPSSTPRHSRSHAMTLTAALPLFPPEGDQVFAAG
jgi:Ni/Fe-hydrogenase subunit HybB-like protein